MNRYNVSNNDPKYQVIAPSRKLADDLEDILPTKKTLEELEIELEARPTLCLLIQLSHMLGNLEHPGPKTFLKYFKASKARKSLISSMAIAEQARLEGARREREQIKRAVELALGEVQG
jgi:hypothetical protein